MVPNVKRMNAKWRPETVKYKYAVIPTSSVPAFSRLGQHGKTSKYIEIRKALLDLTPGQSLQVPRSDYKHLTKSHSIPMSVLGKQLVKKFYTRIGVDYVYFTKREHVTA